MTFSKEHYKKIGMKGGMRAWATIPKEKRSRMMRKLAKKRWNKNSTGKEMS